ncbi:molecular chaperone [Zhongshania sp.]|uniref:fimbrial biogenesis chaperone n=1 Tax=Zhongshania sp. TaxID=1971902 RepID=UPI0035638031
MNRIYLIIFLFAVNIAHAQISVDKNIIDISSDRRHGDITVYNSGKNPEDVRISVFSIRQPGLATEQRFRSDNPRELGIIATPRQFTLAPEQRRKIRLSFLKPAIDQDQIYRMLVEPLPKEKQDTTPSNSLITLNIAYELLLIKRPPQYKIEYSANRIDGGLSIHNTGNSNFLLFSGEQCNTLGEDCRSIAGKRIYAGARHRFELPHGESPVQFMLNIGDDTRAVRF